MTIDTQEALRLLDEMERAATAGEYGLADIRAFDVARTQLRALLSAKDGEVTASGEQTVRCYGKTAEGNDAFCVHSAQFILDMSPEVMIRSCQTRLAEYRRFVRDALRRIAAHYGIDLPLLRLRRQAIAKARGKNWRNVR